MRLELPIQTFLFSLMLLKPTTGFVSQQQQVKPSTLSPSSLGALSRAEEAAQNAAAAAGAMKTIVQPKLFEEDLLEDMQQSLLKLEKRVKNGPGSISVLEAEEFGFATLRILEEMKLNEHNRPKPAPAFSDAELEAEAAASAPPAPTAAVAPPVEEAPVRAGIMGVTDMSQDEGPAYDGSGSMGLAQGTANTYVIPGMDEMSPEEYRDALQKTISSRQSKRVNDSGEYGNIRSNDYLTNLGGAGSAKKRWDPRNEGEAQPMPFRKNVIKRDQEASSAPPAPTTAAAAAPPAEEAPARAGIMGVTDMSQDEGPAYDGSGSMGLAQGTANTYVIPGMDEMSPEEYRDALQKTISSRQSKRVNDSGEYGNIRSNDYLTNLGSAGSAKERWDPKNDGGAQPMPFRKNKIKRDQEE